MPKSGSAGGAFPKLYWLNGSATKLHNVRAEPIKEAAVVGHLVADKQVFAVPKVYDATGRRAFAMLRRWLSVRVPWGVVLVSA